MIWVISWFMKESPNNWVGFHPGKIPNPQPGLFFAGWCHFSGKGTLGVSEKAAILVIKGGMTIPNISL